MEEKFLTQSTLRNHKVHKVFFNMLSGLCVFLCELSGN